MGWDSPFTSCLRTGHKSPDSLLLPGHAESCLHSVCSASMVSVRGPFWISQQRPRHRRDDRPGIYLWGPSPLCLLLELGTDLTCSKQLKHPAGCVHPRCHGIKQNFIKLGLNRILLGRKPISFVHSFFFSPLPCPSAGLVWGNERNATLLNDPTKIGGYPSHSLCDFFLHVCSFASKISTRCELQHKLEDWRIICQ